LETPRFQVLSTIAKFALQSGDRLNRVSATHCLRTRFRQAEVLDLTRPDQILYRARDILDRHVGIDTVLVEQVDGIDSEALQRGLRDLFDVPGPTVQAGLLAIGNLEAELGRDCHLPAEWCKCLAHEFLVDERAVDLRGIE
jgi:hypothetical protein